MAISDNEPLFRRRLRARFGLRSEEFSDGLVEMLLNFWKDAVAHGRGKMCLRCGSQEGVELESARTAYEPTEEDPNPNADVPYCRPCAAEHHEFWDDRWNEYNAGRL